MEVAKAADYGTYIELNAKHLNLSFQTLYEMSLTGAEFIASSDAHHFSRIAEFSKLEEFMKKLVLIRQNLSTITKTRISKEKIRLKEF